MSVKSFVQKYPVETTCLLLAPLAAIKHGPEEILSWGMGAVEAALAYAFTHAVGAACFIAGYCYTRLGDSQTSSREQGVMLAKGGITAGLTYASLCVLSGNIPALPKEEAAPPAPPQNYRYTRHPTLTFTDTPEMFEQNLEQLLVEYPHSIPFYEPNPSGIFVCQPS